MKTDLDTLRNSFASTYDMYALSRARGEELYRLFHNEQYTQAQLAILRDRGAPAETFNVIKMFSRILLGYYSTVVNTISASPVHPRDAVVAAIANDIADHTFKISHFETEGDKAKLDLMLTGMCVVEELVEDLGDEDDFGRPLKQIYLRHVPSRQALPDYMSIEADNSDMRYVHVFKWVTAEALTRLLKEANSELTLEDFDNEHNFTGVPEADFIVNEHNTVTSGYANFNGVFAEFGNYLVINTVIEDDDGKRWSIIWSNNNEIMRTEITHREARFPYRVQFLDKTADFRYIGLFEDVVESQHAINQALVKLQQAVNSQKIFYEEDAVEDEEQFRNQVNRINALIKVLDIGKIKVENLNREAREQYQIIDKSLERIKMVLGVTDSFLGMAFASDSGRKVKLQQNATTMAVRHLTVKIEQLYRMIGSDVISLAKQYYYANRMLKLTDNLTGDRWLEINKPLKVIRNVNPDGTVQESYIFEEVMDPDTGKPMVKDGKLVMAPAVDADTALDFNTLTVDIDSVSYNDEDEKTQLIMEQMLSGPMGQTLQAMAPDAYLKVISLVMSTTKTRYSGQMADIFKQVADRVAQQGQAPGQAQPQGGGDLGFGQSPKSKALKLPTNTNEGVG